MDSEINPTPCSALVVEGGAMRGIFSTGVLDAFLKENFNPFDMYIGVSAGANNIASYLAEMYQRNFKIYTNYSIRPDFISWRKFLTGGHLVDLDWLWDISTRESRLDFKTLSQKNNYYIGTTEVHSGKSVYMQPTKENIEELLKASSSIPLLYRNFVKLNETYFADGALSDPIPVIKAYKKGAKTIMVLRSRPFSFNMKSSKERHLIKLYSKKYPKLAETMLNRPNVYQQSIEFMRNPPLGVKIIEINPPEDFKTRRLTKDISILKEDYQKGFIKGIEAIKKWNKIYK